jgi:hypothetical protein
MLIEESLDAGVPGLLTTWVRSSTETIARVIAKTITNGMIQIGLGLFPTPIISLSSNHP